MKTINEMSLNELAEYVVTLPGWEWMPGIQTTTGRISRVLFGGGDYYWDGVLCKDPQKVVLEQYLDQHLELDGDYTSDPSGFRPDLNDPATIGCLLAMCRKRISQWFYVEPVRGGGGYVGKVPFLGAPPVTDDMPTGAHALVAALAKEAS